jgi:hypothetical protein
MTILKILCGTLQKAKQNRNRLIRFVWIMTFFLSSNFVSSSSFAKNNLEELIIWKLSDELKLSAEVEKRFSDAVRKFNEKKTESTHTIEGQIQVLKKIKNEKERQLWLDRYRRTLVDFNATVLAEHDEIKKILGNEKYARYLELKSDLNSRIKNLMLSKEAQAISEPKISK